VAGLSVRLGIFGGTFDPPHLGHLILAAEAADQLQLERVLWVITPDPPHKLDQHISPLSQRLELLEAALCDKPGFVISRVDIDRPGPQYAADTVAILRGQYPDSQLFYLLGGDSLRDLPMWYGPQRFLDCLDGLGVMRRPEDRLDLEALEKALPGSRSKVHFVQTPLIDISSRDIRERIQTGRHYGYFLPDAVRRMIETKGTYGRT
jgi:nicotinate-nucleotide adenylyltransferase